MGRRRPLPRIRAHDPQLRAQAERQAVNFMVQGAGAALLGFQPRGTGDCRSCPSRPALQAAGRVPEVIRQRQSQSEAHPTALGLDSPCSPGRCEAAGPGAPSRDLCRRRAEDPRVRASRSGSPWASRWREGRGVTTVHMPGALLGRPQGAWEPSCVPTCDPRGQGWRAKARRPRGRAGGGTESWRGVFGRRHPDLEQEAWAAGDGGRVPTNPTERPARLCPGLSFAPRLASGEDAAGRNGLGSGSRLPRSHPM